MFISTDHWNWDVWNKEDQEEYDNQYNDASGPHCEDGDFNVSGKTKCTLFKNGAKEKKIFSLRQLRLLK